mmetsp:Transcript_7395/g.21074  ORF Transcript_7395/g.21074 Transcript_7395/m.21074 type:complete len:184 (-) Transcript_7395:601-1152(-)|eukprot:scaffold202210_cov32-Tisochrysis_lutea.AAC.1
MSPAELAVDGGAPSSARRDRFNLCRRNAPTPQMTSPPMVSSDADSPCASRGAALVLGRTGVLLRLQLATAERNKSGREGAGLPRLPGRRALDGMLFHAARRPGQAAALKGLAVDTRAVVGIDWVKAVTGLEPPFAPKDRPIVACPLAAMSKTRGTSAFLMASVTKLSSRCCCSWASSRDPPAC